MDTHRLGRRFERLAEVALVRRGWTVVDRNVRYRRREIDLVVRRGPVVAFVEVKGRRGSGGGDPLEAVTGAKRRGIEGVARWWVARHGADAESYRFDVVAVRMPRRGAPEIEHIEGAWRVGE